LRLARWVGALGVGIVGAWILGIWTSIDEPWNYVLAAGVGFLVFAGALAVLSRLQPTLPPPWDASPPAHERPGEIVLPLSWAKGAEATGVGEINWELEGQRNRTITLESSARKLRFIEPMEQTVVADHLPKAVRWRLKRILVIKSLGPHGLVVDEYAAGFCVRAEVYPERQR
jgi:hypothetical protein